VAYFSKDAKPPNEKQAASEIIDLLTDRFGSSPKAIHRCEGSAPQSGTAIRLRETQTARTILLSRVERYGFAVSGKRISCSPKIAERIPGRKKA
jgi:hypothetical protein